MLEHHLVHLCNLPLFVLARDKMARLGVLRIDVVFPQQDVVAGIAMNSLGVINTSFRVIVHRALEDRVHSRSLYLVLLFIFTAKFLD